MDKCTLCVVGKEQDGEGGQVYFVCGNERDGEFRQVYFVCCKEQDGYYLPHTKYTCPPSP